MNDSNRLMSGRKHLESENLLISLTKAIDNPDTPQAIYKTDENQIKSINGKNNLEKYLKSNHFERIYIIKS